MKVSLQTVKCVSVSLQTVKCVSVSLQTVKFISVSLQVRKFHNSFRKTEISWPIQPSSAGIGAMYGPSILYTLPMSVHHTDVKAFEVININLKHVRPAQ